MGHCRGQNKAHQKKMQMHESCSRSNAFNRLICLFGSGRAFGEHLKFLSAGGRLENNTDPLFIDLSEII
jgi:hypothetical protein